MTHRKKLSKEEMQTIRLCKTQANQLGFGYQYFVATFLFHQRGINEYAGYCIA